MNYDTKIEMILISYGGSVQLMATEINRLRRQRDALIESIYGGLA